MDYLKIMEPPDCVYSGHDNTVFSVKNILNMTDPAPGMPPDLDTGLSGTFDMGIGDHKMGGGTSCGYLPQEPRYSYTDSLTTPVYRYDQQLQERKLPVPEPPPYIPLPPVDNTTYGLGYGGYGGGVPPSHSPNTGCQVAPEVVTSPEDSKEVSQSPTVKHEVNSNITDEGKSTSFIDIHSVID